MKIFKIFKKKIDKELFAIAIMLICVFFGFSTIIFAGLISAHFEVSEIAIIYASFFIIFGGICVWALCDYHQHW
jgi:uncharacterized membrane protein (DUF4010 family)